ncbi:YccT family protein [Aliivibrio wodanis]|uniref:YccT family protein n=1 Tax=Aliivibrio wodanis TaxID=80852 RepID=UPI00406C0E63
MKMMLKVLVSASLLIPFYSQANVNIQLHRDIAPVAVNGESLGFTLLKKNDLELNNGINQLVVRVEKLVVSEYGEREKYNSVPIIITFDSQDSDLELLTPQEITRTKQSTAFDKKPNLILKNTKTNKEIAIIQQDVLPSAGGITRDYEKEIARFNKKNNIQLGSASVIAIANIDSQKKIEPLKTNHSDSKNTEMLKYWYDKASDTERSVFTDLAFENRKSNINTVKTESSQNLQMMAHWFNESNNSDKKEIISWLFDREK